MTCLQGYQLLRNAVKSEDAENLLASSIPSSPERLEANAFEQSAEDIKNEPDFEEEDVIFFSLIEEKVFIPVSFRQRWSRAAFIVAIIAVAVTLSISISSFYASHETGSSSIFSCAFDAMLEAVSTFVVLWRFKDLNSDDGGSDKERLATLMIAFCFLLTGAATLAASVVHFCLKDHPNQTQQLLGILLFSAISHLILAYSFFYTSCRLRSSSLRAEAVDNALAGTTSVCMLISTVLYRAFKPGLWWLDHSVAIMLGVVSLMYGVKLIVFDVEQCGPNIACAGTKKKDNVGEEEIALLSYFEPI